MSNPRCIAHFRRVPFLLATIALCSGVLGIVQDYRVWRPKREARRKLILMHERLAAYYDKEIADEGLHRFDSRVRASLIEASKWEKERVRELKNLGSFDPAVEQQWDDMAAPFDRDSFSEILDEYHFPRQI